MAVHSIIYYSLLIILMLISCYLFSNQFDNSSTSKRLHSNKKYSNYNIIFPSILFAVFFGMRYNVGYDYEFYLADYIGKYDSNNYEYLFSLITRICQYFGFHFSIYFAILAFLQIFFYIYAFRRNKELVPFLIFFIIADAFFLFWMNGIRQGIAISIWIFSLYYITENKFWKYAISVIIASLFHSSAIVLLIFYPIFCNSKFKLSSIFWQIILMIITLIFRNFIYSYIISLESFLQFFVSITSSKYSFYLENGTDIIGFGVANISSFIWRITLIFFIILYSKKMSKFYNNIFFDLIYVLFFYGMLLLNISPQGSIFHRVTIYFEIFRPIMLSFLCFYLFKTFNLSNKIIYYIVIVGYIGLFIVRQLVADEDSRTLFQFYFQQ